MTRVMGKISFPDKKSPTPKIGSVWEVRVSGGNAAGTVSFLRLVREISQAEIAAKAAKEAAEEAAKEAAEEAAKAAAYAAMVAAEEAAFKSAQTDFLKELEKAPFSTPGCNLEFRLQGETLEVSISRWHSASGRYLRGTRVLPWRTLPHKWEVREYELNLRVELPNGTRKVFHFSSIPEWMEKSSLANCLASEDLTVPSYSPGFSEEYEGKHLRWHYATVGGWRVTTRVVTWNETSYSSGGEYEGALGSKWDSGGEVTSRHERREVIIRANMEWREGHSYGQSSLPVNEAIAVKYLAGNDVTSEVVEYIAAQRAASLQALKAEVSQERTLLGPIFMGLREIPEIQALYRARKVALDKVIAADLAAIERAFS